ncbi:STAS domain-containing protein [Burkholderiaceae bacterium DAT-1]|nr:STAS domain-containing protein [Burkholderiaceae bacterium DAT-1]
MAVNGKLIDHCAVISIQGQFNFSLHQSFRETTQKLLTTAGVNAVDVNLNEANYIDSSALGMLLVLRETANRAGISRLKISGAKGSVQKVLAIAKFDKFFTLE